MKIEVKNYTSGFGQAVDFYYACREKFERIYGVQDCEFFFDGKTNEALVKVSVREGEVDVSGIEKMLSVKKGSVFVA